MSLYKIQGKTEKLNGIYYEFNSSDRPLGEGGMGKVYKGRCIDESTGKSRYVAVKFMYSDLPEYAIEKARREAAIQFKHENLIQMLGFIETESKSVIGETLHHYHVVSELLEGVSLDNFFQGKLTDQNGNPVAFAETLYRDYQQDVNRFAIKLIKNILSGLMTMHDAGYIHRDIDPTNIMITADGKIKLIDFGIAKKMNSLTTHDKHLTQTGQFVGKPEYAAPELVLGAINEQNQTTDIYAIGILLFQCIVGHVPFEGDRSDILQKQLHAPLPLKLVKHPGLREIIKKATDKSRAKRYQSAAEFRVALDNPFPPRRKWGYTISSIAAICIIGFGGYALYPYLMPDNPDPPIEVATATYSKAVSLLHNGETEKGLTMLTELSNKKDADATYLLSRLYFKSRLEGDYIPDTIISLQNKNNIPVDNIQAHNLLIKSVDQNPKNYHALYELACDYWKADQRTEAISNRDGEKAKSYFYQALNYAKSANDDFYVKKINSYLSDVAKWDNM